MEKGAEGKAVTDRINTITNPTDDPIPVDESLIDTAITIWLAKYPNDGINRLIAHLIDRAGRAEDALKSFADEANWGASSFSADTIRKVNDVLAGR